jgi:hypothetical protein
MNSKGSRIILILVVSLTALSSAMKELNQIRQFGLEANQFVAEWSEKLAPAEIPAPVLAREETCQIKQSVPAVELPWLNHVAQAEEPADVEVPEAAEAALPVTKRTSTEAKRERLVKVDPVQFEVRILNDNDGDQDVPAVYEFPKPSASFKFKTHKFNFIKINPRDREILKTLNRGLNLRVAS